RPDRSGPWHGRARMLVRIGSAWLFWVARWDAVAARICLDSVVREAAALKSRMRHAMRRPVLAILRLLPLLTASRRLPPGGLRGAAQIALNRRTATMPVQYEDVATRFGFLMSGDTRDFIQRYIFVFGVWE